MKKENMNEPTHASDATHQTDEKKFLEDLIFDSFIMASSDIVELAEVKNLDGCNYNENETPASSGNQDVISSNDTSKGNNQKNSHLEHIYWYIGNEKYYPSYPPQEPAQSKSSIKTTLVKSRKYQDHYYNSKLNITQRKMQKTYYAI